MNDGGGVGGGARASPCRPVAAPPPTRRGSLGFFTEPGCVTAAWPREPSGVPETREAPVPASVWVPAGAGREQRSGGGAAEPRKRGKGSERGGRTRPGGPRGVPRAAGGRPPPPLALLLRRLSVPHPRPLRSEPPRQGPRSRGRTRLGRSLSPLARPVLPRQGESRVPLPPSRRWPAICSRAGLGGGSAPAGPCRAERARAPAHVPVSRETGARCRAREKESCAAVPAPCPRRRGKGRPPGSVPRRLSGDGAAGPAQAPGSRPPPPPVPSLPCRHRRVRDAAPAGRSGARAGAVRVGRARRRAGRSARARAAGGGYLVDPASSICLSQSLSHACLSTHGRYSETANGSLNQLWFLWSLLSHSLDNCGNSRANTCRRAPTSGDACIYQTKTNPGPPGSFGDSR